MGKFGNNSETQTLLRNQHRNLLSSLLHCVLQCKTQCSETIGRCGKKKKSSDQKQT